MSFWEPILSLDFLIADTVTDSLVKRDGLESYPYRRHVFRELPAAQTPARVKALPPYNVDAATLSDTTIAPKGGVG